MTLDASIIFSMLQSDFRLATRSTIKPANFAREELDREPEGLARDYSHNNRPATV
jgi:hypothetical protein